jgi:hypothetical protein
MIGDAVAVGVDAAAGAPQAHRNRRSSAMR